MTDIELEALHHCYEGESLQVILGKSATTITFKLTPRNIPSHRYAYIAATLILEIGNNYPDSPPSISLTDISILPDQHVQNLTNELRQEAHSMIGEMILGHLCEIALDKFTALNKPYGTCAICLEPLAHKDHTTMLKLDCYHCFHLDCFASWYTWEQSHRAEKHKQILQDYKSMAHQQLAKHGILPHTLGHVGLPSSSWPSCDTETKSLTNSGSIECLHGIEQLSLGAPTIDRGSDDITITEGNELHKCCAMTLYTVFCPWCRYHISPRDLEDMLPLLLEERKREGSITLDNCIM